MAAKQITKLIKWNNLIKKSINKWLELIKCSKIPNPPKILWLKWKLNNNFKCKIWKLRILFTISNNWDKEIQIVKLRKDAYK